ncbi:5-oxoprolinase subunit C family protein [Sutcliffiella halmapala]|uniref:5-oxoprolinase subunit C family protein n=1 Tax=Sutcliffiella halmapala TaxID=79882 RepID=UPI0009950D14|nr:biotin-dependent carboxyltransferase family protein [Sutcliffiella halmapala]
MTFPLFRVEKTGLLTSFQDLGRKHFQSKGVVASGAMDSSACQIANLLVGNKKEEASIEIAIQGPSLTVLAKDAIIAICGADLSPTINGAPVEMWKTLYVKEGDKIEFGAQKAGVYAYLAVRGGYAVPTLLGSKAFYSKESLGKRIQKGTIISAGAAFAPLSSRGLRHNFSYPRDVTVRVISGPHEKHFTPKDIEYFFSQPYQISQGDRMGYRLQGGKFLSASNSNGIASDAIPLGGIQVPDDGQPIVLLADRQTTGGYRRIGTVISADISKLVQVPVGGIVHFKEVNLEEAYKALLEQHVFLKHLAHVAQKS